MRFLIFQKCSSLKVDKERITCIGPLQILAMQLSGGKNLVIAGKSTKISVLHQCYTILLKHPNKTVRNWWSVLVIHSSLVACVGPAGTTICSACVIAFSCHSPNQMRKNVRKSSTTATTGNRPSLELRHCINTEHTQWL